jgi:hypothetical protein
VKRKQNERESLTNISDFTFEFFKTLELFCRERLTHKRLVDMGQFLFRVVKDEVITIQNFRNIIIIPFNLT